ncbi:hypothetical protein [Allobranchiibius sp. CTAmp26]|uniref:hypothetical protein n=1 Tax=Allobranchiibius sp. CTAmp26 TaxID=2815214 RepID=UPI001AA1CCF8|nr:hypothetical protein [Allobranchiibius sp. CTAmp26]MBO1755329.1 hypothetical protein [Allobranchiibius sp. CTAmp26]
MTRDDDAPAGPQQAAGHGRRADDGAEAADALVAEATRLADAFTSWVGGVGSTGDDEADGARAQAPPEGPAQDPVAEPAGDRARTDGPAASASPACDCGRTAGLDAICRVCPVCRVAAYMHTVRPEVLVRVADVLAMVAGSLQLIAADRSGDPAASEQTSTNDAEDGPGRPDPRPTEAGVSIPVRGDAEPERH